MNSTIKELILSKVINFEEFWLSFISAVFWLIYTFILLSLLLIILVFLIVYSPLFFFIDSFLFPSKPSWFFFLSLATRTQILGFPQRLPSSSIFSGCGEPVLRCSWGGNIQWACLLVSLHDTGWCVSPISLVREMQAQVCRASDVRDYLGSHFTDELRGGDGMKTQAG